MSPSTVDQQREAAPTGTTANHPAPTSTSNTPASAPHRPYSGPQPRNTAYSFTIGTLPISINRTVPAVPKSIVAVARGPEPSVDTTVPSPYLS